MSPVAVGSKVIVVDDEPLIRKLVSSVLAGSGYMVLDAESAEQAMEIMERHPCFDLLVTDVVMPKVDGCELADRMRRRRPDLKVLFMSGYDPVCARSQSPDGSNYLQKPFRVTELLERVGRMLRG